ncbi:MAG TPA: glycosyltransferase family 2 protein [Solimonas sp.]
MSAAPAVSVILPTHNRARTLDRAIDGVLTQGWRDLELIVVDDASSDDTAQRMAARRDPRLRYLRLEQNVGPAAARNRAVAIARGEWLAFQDSDDEWFAGKLESQLQLARDLPPDYAVIGSTLLRVGNGDRVERVRWPLRAGSTHDVDVPAFLASAMAYLQSMLIRRSAFDAIGGFDETLPVRSDIELCLRLLPGQRFAAVDLPLALSWETPGGVSLQHDRRLRCTERIIERHQALLAAHPDALAQWWYGQGYHELLMSRGGAARRALHDSLRNQPAALRSWLLLGLTLLPSAAFRFLRNCRRR